MSDITKLLNGIDLHNPARGWSLQKMSTIRPGMSNRRVTVDLPGVPGSLVARHRAIPTERTVGLTWLLKASSQAGLEGSWRDLMALLSSTPLTYSHVSAGVRHDAQAQLVSVSDVSDDDFLVGTYLRFSALLALPGVYLRDTAFQTLDVPAGSSTHTVLAGSAPITDAVVRWGPFPLDPGVLSLTDVTTGTGVSFDQPASPVDPGNYVYLWVSQLRAHATTSVAAWEWATDTRSSRVDYPGPGPLQLWPTVREAGGNLIREVRLQSSHPCTIRYRRAYL